MKKFLPLFVIISTCHSQPDFQLTVDDYLWGKVTGTKVDLFIWLTLKNIGSEPGVDDDINYLYLDCSQKQYKYGKDIQLVGLSSKLTYSIQPGKEEYGYISFSVPKDADNLSLKFPESAGSASKWITMNYINWMYYNKDPKIFTDLGQKYFREADYFKSMTNYLKALKVDPNLKISFQLANTYIMLDDYDNAITYYEKSLFEGTEKSIVYNNLGYAYFEKGYYQDAINNFSKAYQKDKGHWDAVLGASISYYETKDFYSAEYYYKMAADIENLLYRGMEGLGKLMDNGYFYTDKQLASINSLCKYLGYSSY